MVNKKCAICDVEFKSYRGMSAHLKRYHELSARQYHDQCLSIGKCEECGGATGFKNLNIGYLKFCSVGCLNRNKAKDPVFLKYLSDVQRGVPRKKHTEETKRLVAENSRRMWADPMIRAKTMATITSESYRERMSKITAETGYHKHVTFIDGVRCESKAEEKFIHKCKREGRKVERFHDDGRKTFHINNRHRLPDFLLDNVVVDVKDFHPWFKVDLFNGLGKYWDIVKHCNEKEYIFIFWFEKYGYQTIEDMAKIKDEEGLRQFKVKNANAFSKY